jgi:hypothetical protein
MTKVDITSRLAQLVTDPRGRRHGVAGRKATLVTTLSRYASQAGATTLQWRRDSWAGSI